MNLKTLLHFVPAVFLLTSISAIAHDSFYITTDKQGNDIRIQRDSGNKLNTHFIVNGKKFSWSDLTPKQQARIEELQHKIEELESGFRLKEEEFDRIEDKLDMAFDELAKWDEELAEQYKADIPQNMSVKERKALEEVERKSLTLEKHLQAEEKRIAKLERKIRQLEKQIEAKTDPLIEELEKLIVSVSKTI